MSHSHASQVTVPCCCCLYHFTVPCLRNSTDHVTSNTQWTGTERASRHQFSHLNCLLSQNRPGTCLSFLAFHYFSCPLERCARFALFKVQGQCKLRQPSGDGKWSGCNQCCCFSLFFFHHLKQAARDLNSAHMCRSVHLNMRVRARMLECPCNCYHSNISIHV